jgi:hypothetical protein
MLSAEELMTKARYEDDLDKALEGAVIIRGAGGSAEEAGGACPGFVVVSEKPIAEVIPRLQALASEVAEQGVTVVYSRAHS